MRLIGPNLAPFFCHAEPFPDRPDVLRDPEFSTQCGYATEVEAKLLYMLARMLPGFKWLEIGGHTGWTAAHLLAGGAEVRSMDIEYHRDAARGAEFCRRASENIRRVFPNGTNGYTQMGGNSAEMWKHPEDFESISDIGAAFIDGNHEDDYPLNDAIGCADIIGANIHAEKINRGMIVFHDAVGEPILRGITELANRHWNVRVFDTRQMLTVCWVGDIDVRVIADYPHFVAPHQIGDRLRQHNIPPDWFHR